MTFCCCTHSDWLWCFLLESCYCIVAPVLVYNSQLPNFISVGYVLCKVGSKSATGAENSPSRKTLPIFKDAWFSYWIYQIMEWILFYLIKDVRGYSIVSYRSSILFIETNQFNHLKKAYMTISKAAWWHIVLNCLTDMLLCHSIAIISG